MSDRENIKKLDHKNFEIPTKNERYPKNRQNKNKKTRKIESNKIIWSRSDLSAIILSFLLTSIF